MYNELQAIDFFDNHPDLGGINMVLLKFGKKQLMLFINPDFPDRTLIRNNISGALIG